LLRSRGSIAGKPSSVHRSFCRCWLFGEPAGINPIAPLDPVIIVQNLSSLLYFLAIFRYGMLEWCRLGVTWPSSAWPTACWSWMRKPHRRPEPAASQVLGCQRGDFRASGGEVLAAYPQLCDSSSRKRQAPR